MTRLLRAGLILATIAGVEGLRSSAYAGHLASGEKIVREESSPFDKRTVELQIGVGGYHSFGNYSKSRPRLVDVGGTVRVGTMLTAPQTTGRFRGNFELLGELYGGAIVEGPGDGVAVGTVLLRYNSVRPDSRWIPYMQIGAGGVYSDVYQDRRQCLLGSALSFNLSGGFGVRYLMRERCALFVEMNYHHFSNAGLSDRNCGQNTVGGFFGATFLFP